LGAVVYSNLILDKAFGIKKRFIPTHGPIIMDKDLIEDMQEAFPAEFDLTSSYRVRDGKNI
jgi:UDP-N-acetylglucosamine-lysosomal-enzyme